MSTAEPSTAAATSHGAQLMAPMRARSPHEPHRAATPLELLFDLVFVVAIAQAALMTLAVGFSTMILPHQVPPVVVGLHVASIPFRVAMRYTLPIAGVSLFILLPIDYLWWRLIGYFD